MHPRRRVIQVTCMLLITLSGLLLGASQGVWQLTFISFLGGFLGLLLVDWLRVIRIQGWLANTASILILLFAMKDFYGGDSAAKLISVGQLLVYLQTVLMFQEKTPRLYWQVLVLSLLQVVVASIFNLNFEGGLLFVIYFAVAGTMMMLQCDFTQWFEVKRVNRMNVSHARSRIESLGRGSYSCDGSPACLVFEPQVPNSYGRLVRNLIPWLTASLVFSTVLFYNIPRLDTPWLGPGVKKVTATGLSLDLDLNNKGEISDSGRLIFRAWFSEPQTERKIPLAENPYFRGMPLPRWGIQDGVTTWKAPYDSIFEFSYERLASAPNQRAKALIADYSIEATTDPLLFTVTPSFRLLKTSQEVEYCRDISALTRRRRGNMAEMAAYQYTVGTLVDLNNYPLDSSPYRPDVITENNVTLPDNVGEFKGLTYMERDRYPEVVAAADRIARQVGKTDTLKLAREMSNYFLSTNRFSYTLDFRNIDRVNGLDPIEDFFKNHRTGHCQLYASALTVMLRSQNIPARLVVGFYGGEYNQLNECYMVRERHAHAWVEAYIPPEDCTEAMFATGGAGPGGAWLRLDPTSNINSIETLVSNGEALEMARALWQDYILGMDEAKRPEPITVNSSQLLGLMDLSNWQATGQKFTAEVQKRPIYQYFLLAIVFGLIVMVFLRKNRLQPVVVKRKSSLPLSRIRKLMGNALFWLSPELGTWVMGDVYVRQIVPFYEKMIGTLKREHNLERGPYQTQREFASEVADHFTEHPGQSDIQSAVEMITEAFYRVRFGERPLNNHSAEQVERMAKELDAQLKIKLPPKSDPVHA